MRLETGASVMERVKAMRSDEEFYAYVWEKYRQRHPKDGRRTSIAPPGGGYQYQSPTALPPRRLRSGRVVAAVVAVLAAVNDGKITFLAACGKDAVAKGVKAGDIIKAVAPICGGKGGGKPDSAMGGGSDVLKLDNALATVDDFVSQKLGL